MDEAEKIFLLENEMEVEYRQIHEVLRCLIHTIVFNRALGCITPVEVDSELFDDVTYVKCDDQKVERYVQKQAESISNWLEKNPGQRAQVSVIFSEEKAYKTFGISRVKKRKWEQWLLLIRMTSGGNDEEARCERQQRLELMVRQNIASIIHKVNESMDHLPPTTWLRDRDGQDEVVFPFEITVLEELEGNVRKMLTRLLQANPPKMT